MQLLHEAGFPVPKPLDHSRHCIVMEFIDAPQLRQYQNATDPAGLYDNLMGLIVRMGEQGIIHGDFNEFNILVFEDGTPIVIDFPQIVSIDHPDAKAYFERDVECVHKFIESRFGFVGEERPRFEDLQRKGDLDIRLEITGVSKKSAKELEAYRNEILQEGTADSVEDDEEDNDNEEEEDNVDIIPSDTDD